jgi:hypothetical protein
VHRGRTSVFHVLVGLRVGRSQTPGCLKHPTPGRSELGPELMTFAPAAVPSICKIGPSYLFLNSRCLSFPHGPFGLTVDLKGGLGDVAQRPRLYKALI